MAHRSPARWLAPLALVAFIVALFAVVGGGSGDGGSPPANDTAPATSTQSEESDGARRPRKTYTVKLGDTPSQIATEHDITLEQLQRLNPDLDPQLLSPGQKVRIRR
jgi:LysM repeat protein